MKEFVIDKNADGMRLDKFMARVMPNVPSGVIYKSLRKKKVRVNQKHVDGAFRLSLGDVVLMYINDECFESDFLYEWMSVSGDIKVVYEDENILIADKPSGMFSQDTEGCKDSVESRMRSYLYQKGEVDLSKNPPFIPSLCHRIDRNTEGLVIAAKNAETLKILNEKIKNREIRKFYLCQTERTPQPPSGKICGYLLKNADRKMIFSDKKTENAVYCETVYRTVKQGMPATVEAELLTGKTHQIRASLAYIGCPLMGDVKYGAKRNGDKTYQKLRSYKIIFDFKTDSGILEYLNGKTIIS